MRAARPAVFNPPSRACSVSGGKRRMTGRRRFSVFPFFCVPDFPAKRFSPLAFWLGARSPGPGSLRCFLRPPCPACRFPLSPQADKSGTDIPSSADTPAHKDILAQAGNPSQGECPPSREAAAADNTAAPDGTAAAPAQDAASSKAAKRPAPASGETARDPPPDKGRNGCRRPGRTTRPAKRASRNRCRGRRQRHGSKAARRFPLLRNRRSRSPVSPRPSPACRIPPPVAVRETYPAHSRMARAPVRKAGPETWTAAPRTERATLSAPPTLPPAGSAPP